MKEVSVPVDAVVFREDLYPRMERDPALVQRYAADLDVLPPIEVNQHNELIDGWHRWTGHKKNGADRIRAIVTETRSEAEFLALAIRRNASHGKQLEDRDKRKMAIHLFAGGEGYDKKQIAEILSVSPRRVTDYLTDIERQLRAERAEKIKSMWLACHTLEEIAAAVGMNKATVSRDVEECCNLDALPKCNKLAALYEDADFSPPLYDIWSFKDNANETKHFGNTHVGIVDNLLYTFTRPLDIVIDPFGGGGSTIDVCRRRLRRYWVSDRKPIPERPDMRQCELTADNIAGPARWADVALVYLDPPYWAQARGAYSDDPADLGNMPLQQFTDTLAAILNGYARKLKAGAHIALIIQPTQWKTNDRSTVFHDLDMVSRAGKGLRLVRRAICPYSTQQYNPQMVETAKAEKLWLVLSRTLLVWQVQ